METTWKTGDTGATIDDTVVGTFLASIKARWCGGRRPASLLSDTDEVGGG